MSNVLFVNKSKEPFFLTEILKRLDILQLKLQLWEQITKTYLSNVEQ